jgi:hypothetical protein
MNVYIFDVVEQASEIEVAIMTTLKPDETPVVIRRFHGTDVHGVFREIARFVAAERKKRTAAKEIP